MAVDTNTLESDGASGTGIQAQSAYQPVSGLNIYEFMEMTHDGSGIYRDGTGLIPHSREMDYSRRREIAFYKNFLRPIVRAMIEPVFTEEAIRKVQDINGNQLEGLMINGFIDNADNDGSSLQEVTEDNVTFSRLQGVSFAVVDNFPPDELSNTVQENIDNRTFPYVYMRKPNEVAAYQLDRFGKIEKIAFFDSGGTVESDDKKVFSKDNEKKKNPVFIRVWDKEKSQVFKKDDENGKYEPDGDPFFHNLGVVPVVALFSVRRKNKSILLVDPPLYDIAKLNYTIFNKDSEIREIERAQGFSFLYAQGIEPGDLTIGVDNYLNVPEGMTIQPDYCSPDPNIQKVLMENSDAIREDIFRIAEQNGVTGITDQSGVAKQWDFFAHESVLKKTSSMAVSLEEKIVEIFQLYTKEEFIYVVEYKTDFQPNNILKEIEQYERYLDTQPGPKGRGEAMGSISRLVFRDQPIEIVNEIVEEEKSIANDEAQSKAKGASSAE